MIENKNNLIEKPEVTEIKDLIKNSFIEENAGNDLIKMIQLNRISENKVKSEIFDLIEARIAALIKLRNDPDRTDVEEKDLENLITKINLDVIKRTTDKLKKEE